MKKRWIGGLLALALAILLSTAALADGSITITKQPTDLAAPIGTTVSATVEASADGAITYQWYYKSPNGNAWKTSGMKGCKTPTIYVPVTAARIGQQYKCVLTAGDESIESDVIVVREKDASEITIVTQPQDIRTAIGTSGTAAVEAVSDAELSYRWYFKSVNSDTWKVSGMTGCKTDTISVPVTTARIGQQYKCVISTNDGGRVETDAVTILKTAPSVITVDSQPGDMYGTIGESVSATAAASTDNGAALTYRWYFKSNGSAVWKASGMAGYRTATITVPVTKARIGQQYKCVITASDGTVTETDAVTICAKPDLSLAITRNPDTFVAQVGQPIQLEISVSGEDSGYPMSYQWYQNSAAVEGANEKALIYFEVQPENAGTYYCVVSGYGYELTSNPATVTVVD